jgi:molybdopterin/thiamine biosynthesis adenylyltransferase
MEQTIREINPDVEITNFKEGISLENLDDFLRGVDIYLDSSNQENIKYLSEGTKLQRHWNHTFSLNGN